MAFDEQATIMEIIRRLQEQYSQHSMNGTVGEGDCIEERYHTLCQKYDLLLEENEHLRINIEVYQVGKSTTFDFSRFMQCQGQNRFGFPHGSGKFTKLLKVASNYSMIPFFFK